MRIGNRRFDGGTHVMAIINLTPDSFFAGSRTNTDEVLKRVEKAVEDGAEVIDIGGQSTRPGHVAVSADEEWNRLESPVRLIKSNFDIPLSVDTYYPSVARRALASGADMINDIWGLQYEDNGDMARAIAEYGASVCIMQNQNNISTDENLWDDIFKFLDRSVEIAKQANIAQDRILIDGGIGFGKNKEQNFAVVNGYDKLGRYGYPLLLGTSRKSMFGGNVEDRLEPTLETTRIAVRKKVMFVRVHDVKENARAIYEESKKIRAFI